MFKLVNQPFEAQNTDRAEEQLPGITFKHFEPQKDENMKEGDAEST